MRDRGKRELEAYNNGGDFYGENIMPEFPCKKHPSSSSSTSAAGGICAYCLTDRLVQLVCPVCGEQRLSSCSCSDEISSNPNSSSADVGSVGRISFLLENDKSSMLESSSVASKPSRIEHKPPGNDHNDIAVGLRRSNSTCVDIGRRESVDGGRGGGGGGGGGGGFWKIGRLFRKKRDKQIKQNNENSDHQCVGVSRSRSLCSFRGFYDSNTEESGGFPVSSSAARASSVSANFMLDSAKRSCFSESEARISNFDYDAGFMGPNKNIFSLKESEFISCGDEDPAFIDLKLHDLSSSSDSRPDQVPVLMRRGTTKEFGFRNGGNSNVNGDVFGGHEMFRNGGGGGGGGGGSCRISSVSEREMRKCRKSYKVWKWFFRHQNSNSRRKNHDEDEDPYGFRS